MKTLIQTEWRLLLFGLLMTFWSSPGQTFFISLFSGAIREDLALSHAQFGGIYSLATLASAAVVIWSGALIDRIPLRRLSSMVIIALAASTFVLSLSNSAILLLIALFLVRQFGQSLMMLIASTTLVRYLDSAKGKATALGGMGYHLAEAIMPSLIILLLALIGWRASLQTASVFLLLAVLPLTWILLNKHRERHRQYLSELAAFNKSNDSAVADKTGSIAIKTKVKRQWTRKEVLQDKRFYLFMPVFLAHTIFFTGFIFHQIHLIESKGWSLSIWGSLFVMYAVTSIITKLTTGVIVDKIGSIRLVPFVAVPLALGLLLLSSSSHIAAGAGFLFLMSITTGIQTTLSAPFWSDMYGSQNLGSIKSLSSALIAFASALAPFAMGWLIDQGTAIETIAIASAIYILFATLLALYARRLCNS